MYDGGAGSVAFGSFDHDDGSQWTLVDLAFATQWIIAAADTNVGRTLIDTGVASEQDGISARTEIERAYPCPTSTDKWCSAPAPTPGTAYTGSHLIAPAG